MSRMAQEIAPLFATHLGGTAIVEARAYPSPRDLAATLGGGAPHLVFLDMASEREQALQLLTDMTRLEPSIQIVALLAGNEPDLILRCLRAGAVDFLIQPFTSDQMEAALTKLARLQSNAEDGGNEPGKIVAVTPAKGACGATTIACNLAFQWKRLGAQRILLADLDPLAGTMSFLLKIKSTFSFLDALQRAHELDADLWDGMVTKVSGVDVLLSPELMVEGSAELQDPGPILEYARHAYDVVVVDTGGVYGEWNLNTARAANELLLVTTNELPALQAAQRALSYLDTNRIGRWKIRLLVNRYFRDVGLSREVIGTALHTEVFDILPSDYEAVQKSLMEGKPAPSNTVFGKGIMQLADRLGGRTETVKKSTSLGGLLGLFSKTKS
ncbi:MAG TPA: AAA family ATPase [Bryobacteraceae bacterium]|nr:AAA family ATPase [Bryobacteraceae bacterium]